MPSMGGGAVKGLQEVLADLYLRTTMKQQQRAAQQQLEQDQRTGAENTRRWDADHQLRQDAWNRTVEQDRAKATEAAADKTARAAAVDPILNDETIPAPARRLLQLGQHGLGANLNVHALEGPDAHAAHVAAEATADSDRDFAGWKRQQDYTEGLRAKRPALSGRLVKDDPAFPVGVQSHLAQIRSRHQDFEGAVGEFVGSLPQHQQAHPNLSPQKAIAALQAMYTGGGRAPSAASGVDALVASALGGGRATASGRGAGPGTQPAAGPDTGAQSVSLAELEAVARARGTSVAQERARAQASGYVVR